MNCQELIIWFESVSEDEIIHLNAHVEKHLKSCENCQKAYQGVIDAFQEMNMQKESQLPEFAALKIIHALSESNGLSSQSVGKSMMFVSRIAAAIIIMLGILLGILAGNIVSRTNQSKEIPWSAEFSSLSESEDYYTYLFD